MLVRSSFIKLAQVLASRPDLITKPYADEFKKLQDEVPPDRKSVVLGKSEDLGGRRINKKKKNNKAILPAPVPFAPANRNAFSARQRLDLR